ncbi:MAG: prepilin-type N-terminal cleavage/methylation domain-containing protein [Lentisphaerae bacterium]|jgi:general secretion pathway protein G|nr:prepilin-type N-terminal cleavage/methylation domain-containing protein [Lentisphaerota bacterium]
MRARKQAAGGFTLIEMLIVVAIIGLLAAILVPTIMGAVKKANYARAMTEITALEGALKGYFQEYGRMPVPPGGMGGKDVMYSGADQAAVVNALIGRDTSRNAKDMVFLDLHPRSFNVKTLNEMYNRLDAGQPYCDPWGTPYRILMDMDFDDRIQDTGFDTIRAKVAVFSGGPETNVVSPRLKTW